MQRLIEKAGILMEALPYIQKFKGCTFVIKYGGHAMVDEKLKALFARDVVLMKHIGINPVIVHGGGPQITRAMEAAGLEPVFVSGHRVTDLKTMGIVEKALSGVNRDIVGLIGDGGGNAVGLTVKDCVLTARKRLVGGVDVGYVGDVVRVDSKKLRSLEKGGHIPIIAPAGVGKDGRSYNINADLAAVAVATALSAAKLIFLTDTKGILDEKGELIPTLTNKGAERLIRKKVITGGMLPKITACMDALNGRVGKVHIIDGRVQHALLLEIFTDKGVGTEIVL